MTYDRAEDLPLRPPPSRIGASDRGEVPPIIAELTALLPREGNKPGLKVLVSEEEYLARLASLGRKYQGVRHRHDEWGRHLTEARERFDRFREQSLDIDGLPEGAVAGVAVSFCDTRIENELEALLFAIRSTLDVLARLVAAHIPGKDGLKSYHKLRDVLHRDANGALAQAIDAAWRGWIEDMTERRDAAGHYVALSVRSEVRTTGAAASPPTTERVFVAIPATGTKESISIWWTGLPLEVVNASTSYQPSGGSKIEAHGLFDTDGSLIIRRNGPLPALPGMTNADEYVETLVNSLTEHLTLILQILARES